MKAGGALKLGVTHRLVATCAVCFARLRQKYQLGDYVLLV